MQRTGRACPPAQTAQGGAVTSPATVAVPPTGRQATASNGSSPRFAIVNPTPAGTIRPSPARLDEVRSNHGFVIRALGDDGLTLTEIAARLGVTKQAAQKVVDDMESRRLVERVQAEHDRRAKTIRLTKRGQKVRSTALAASKGMEAELRDELGNAAVDAARRTLEHFVERNGGLEEARAGRARPIW